jgi:hypothetical protein
MSRTFLSVGSNVAAGLEPDPEPLSAPLEVELVVVLKVQNYHKMAL